MEPRSAATQTSTLFRLALICGAGQLFAVNFAYLLAAYAGHVPLCVPYWDSCTSISATGRRLPEAALFKGAMLPLAFCATLYWRRVGAFVVAAGWLPAASANWMTYTGVSAAVATAGYTLLLGAEGGTLRGLRHALVILSFALTYMAQVLVTGTVWRRSRAGGAVAPPWLASVLPGLSLATLALGAGSIVAPWFYTAYNAIEDAVEWNLAGLLSMHFVLTSFLFRARPLLTSCR